ncbi:hypothetical protein COV19_03730 [Candidatus Woesearchaeota archaeon CG10_big_fil_rev_8_21_14_0_10_44_13]|nr:MAG: hypothetical protein COV19_03730 [Candidatus Woesearchaeota archaeon CG10_big_fil_rev_8_21_14_0_10_44_13]
MALTTGIIFGLLVMFFWGISKVIINPAIKRIGPCYALFYEQVFVVLPLIIFSLFYTKMYIPSQGTMIRITIAVIAGAIPIYFYFKAMEIGKVSLVTPIANSASIITVFLSYLLYKEVLATPQIAAVMLLIAGVLLISFRYSELKRLKFSRTTIPGAKFAFITMVGWGIYFFLIKPIILEIGPLLSAVYLETGIFLIISLAFIFKSMKSRSIEGFNGVGIYVFFGGLTTAAGSLFFNLAVEKSAVSLIYPLANSSLLITAIASYIFLKERIELNQKIAIFLILLGIILISV